MLTCAASGSHNYFPRFHPASHDWTAITENVIEVEQAVALASQDHFDASTLSLIKEALIGQRAELQDQLHTEAQAFSSSESEIASEIRSDENPAEAGTATFEREKHLSIANNVQDLLEKSTKALEKIEQGSYGICESCGRPIDPDRLAALPHALMCIECKKAEERR